jgi:hypothetical protein
MLDKVKKKEELLGLVSLNYDTVLDEAYKAIFGIDPNYCFSFQGKPQKEPIPLLKLHGSFNWDKIDIRGKRRNLDIIPLGSTKNYLHIPYNFIWSRALELLIQCDVLRVIGCSLSQNDIHLIDLLFKAHLEKGEPFEIQIIGPETTGESIQRTYGFFPRIQRLTQIEPPLVREETTKNAFKTWLRDKGCAMLGDDAHRTRFFRNLTNS